MFPYAILFFDLDGTLLSSDHKTVPERTANTLRALHEQGVLLSIATGRAKCILPEHILSSVPFDFCISSNGADVYDYRTGEHLITRYISAEDARAAYALLKDRGIAIEWYADNEIMLSREDAQRIADVRTAWWHGEYFARGQYPVCEDMEAYFAAGAPKLEKINPLMRSHQEQRPALLAAFEETGRFCLSSSLGHNLEINARGCTKGAAIRALCAEKGIDIQATLAFGDGNNDLEMLQSCGMGVAMGNAMEELKAHAGAVTDTNDKDGIAQYLEGLM